MLGETIQKSLFEIQPKNLDRNNIIAFGITKTGLLKGSYSALENVFYGINNLKIPSEMLGIQNPAEILAQYFAAGGLKRRNQHLNLNIPQNFLDLVNYINWYSYNNKEFLTVKDNFKKYFEDSPEKQKKRLLLLDEKIGNIFVGMFFTKYRLSNKDIIDLNDYDLKHEFFDPNWDGADKGIYADKIYEELERLSEGAKEI